jgi:hypothetical protein
MIFTQMKSGQERVKLQLNIEFSEWSDDIKEC